MKISDYTDQNLLNSIYDKYSNVFGVICNPDILNENKKCFGVVLLEISVKNKKDINLNDHVEFIQKKIKWRSSYPDKKGRKLCLVDAYWCKRYIHDRKIKCSIRVLKSQVEGSERIYYGYNEEIMLTKDQYIKRQLILKFSKYPAIVFEACKNFDQRWWITKDYYRALNETSKHYLIKHEQLKKYVAQYNKAKKEFNEEWNKLLLKYYENNEADLYFDKMYDEIGEEETKVIPFKKQI
jgi:hypothetical protein